MGLDHYFQRYRVKHTSTHALFAVLYLFGKKMRHPDTYLNHLTLERMRLPVSVRFAGRQPGGKSIAGLRPERGVSEQSR